MNRPSFVFTGGGTGGHVYPNIAIYEALRDRFPEAKFLYIGSPAGAEYKIVSSLSQPIPFVSVPSKGLPTRWRHPSAILPLLSILWGAFRSLFVLRRFRPDCVIGSGGYVSAPVIIASALLRIPTFVHEQNAVPGRFNLLIGRFVRRIGVSFQSTTVFFPPDKVTCTGYPLRHSMVLKASAPIRKRFGIPPENRVVFVVGGSMGARSINRAIAEIIPRLLATPNISVILSTGRQYSPLYRAYDDTVQILERAGLPAEIPGRLLVREYIDPIDEVYSMTDLVVSRAGAGVVKELSVLGLPMLLIPKIDLPGDHQIMNAKEIERIGGARIIYEEIHGPGGEQEILVPTEKLLAEIVGLLDRPEALAEMRESLAKIPPEPSLECITREIEALLPGNRSETERRIEVLYLHHEQDETHHELLFPITRIGGGGRADVLLPLFPPTVLADVQLPQGEDEPLWLRRRRGSLQVNGVEVDRWSVLRPGDRIGSGEVEYELRRYEETIRRIEPTLIRRQRHPTFSIAGILSRLGELLRTMTTAAVFGAGRTMDLFTLGWALVGLVRQPIKSVMERAFLPIFVRIFPRHPRRAAWETATSITTFVFLLACIVSLAGIVLTPWLLHLLVPRWEPRTLGNAIPMTRWLFASLVPITLASITTTYLRIFRRPGTAVTSSMFYSLGVVATILLLAHSLGPVVLGIAAFTGATIQVLFLLVPLVRVFHQPGMEFSTPPHITPANAGHRKFSSLLGPITGGAFVSRLSPLVERLLAATLAVGSLSFFHFAIELCRLPISFFSRAIPRLALRDSPGQVTIWQRERVRKLFLDGMRLNLFLLTPLMVVTITLAHPIVSVLLERSRFLAAHVEGTTRVIRFIAAGMLGFGLHSLTTRLFSIRLEDRIPRMLDWGMLALQTGLGIVLLRSPLGVAGIALATSVSFTTFALMRIVVLHGRMREDGIVISRREMVLPFGKTAIATLFMSIGLLEARYVFSRLRFLPRPWNDVLSLLSLTFIGLSIYFLVSVIVRNTDFLPILHRHGAAGGSRLPMASLSPSQFLERVQEAPSLYAKEYRYKIDLYLTHGNWAIRNVGIKLVGLFGAREKAEMLIRLLKSGQENGFVRRNAVQALRQLRYWDEGMGPLCRSLLRDSYYEVRVSTLRLLEEALPEDEAPSFAGEIACHLKVHLFEEQTAALRLAAAKGDERILPLVEPLFLASNSRVREEVVELLGRFHRRGLLAPDRLKEMIGRVLITSNNLIPEFRIKSIVRRIGKEISPR